MNDTYSFLLIGVEIQFGCLQGKSLTFLLAEAINIRKRVDNATDKSKHWELEKSQISESRISIPNKHICSPSRRKKDK
tara:strand:+ start:955 stop:1188 length:234 start_codon:yes stop_codon:yes gene_type:complete